MAATEGVVSGLVESYCETTYKPNIYRHRECIKVKPRVFTTNIPMDSSSLEIETRETHYINQYINLRGLT